MTLLEQLEYYKNHRSRVSEYLQDRGIEPKTASEFELGYCPEDGSFFHGRFMIPMADMQGDIVAFCGRRLTGDGPKYINSPESELYKKSKLLYGLDRSQDYILQEGYAVCVEGQIDLIQLWQNGIRNVVATCGTALSKFHIRSLKRFADSVVICYDSDSAGEKAAERAIEGLAEERLPLKYAAIPEGLDPDEFVRVYGRDNMIEVLLGAK